MANLRDFGRVAGPCALALVLAACGGDDDPVPGDTASTESGGANSSAGGTAGGSGGSSAGGAGGSSLGGSGGSSTDSTSSGGAAGAASDLDLEVCNPDSGGFTIAIDNPYLPFPVGKEWVYQGEEDGATIDLVITVLDETQEVAGVLTRVVQEHEEEDGELVEISRNFFAQAEDGTVCYFGEEVDIYEDGEVVSHEGAWLAGGDNQPGILMPANPVLGMSYQQEVAPGVAMDRAEIVGLGDAWTVPAGSYDDVLETDESTPLEPGSTSHKVYAPEVGLIVDDPVELVSVTE